MLLFFIKIIFVLIHLVIGIYDFSFYRIPNFLLGALLVLYAFYAPLYVGIEGILSSLLIFAVFIALGFALYAFKYIGAGDAKYLAVASLWAGPHVQGVIQFVLIVTLIGGVIGIIYLLLKHHLARLSDWVWSRIQRGESHYPALQSIWMGSAQGAGMGKRENIDLRMVPYGLAIAAGAIITMLIVR